MIVYKIIILDVKTLNRLKEIYKYREMIISLVRKDLRTRYKGSVLGFLWTFINPLLQLIVYSIVFSFVMRVKMENYYMYMFVGLLPWIFFCNALQLGSISIVSNRDLIKKIYFPRLVLPIATLGSSFMNFLFSLIVLFIALLVSGIGISIYFIYVPVLCLILLLFASSFTFILAACNVYLRDLEHIIAIVTMSWFYAVPILYPIEMVPNEFQELYRLDPIVPIILSFQDAIYYKRLPNIESLINIGILSIILLVISYFVFEKLQKNFAEEF